MHDLRVRPPRRRLRARLALARRAPRLRAPPVRLRASAAAPCVSWPASRGCWRQVDARDLEPDAGAPLPPTLLPSLVREVPPVPAPPLRRRRGRAAAVAAVAVGALAVGARVEADGAPTAAAPRAAAASPVRRPADGGGRRRPVRADVLVAGVAWGTRLDLHVLVRGGGGRLRRRRPARSTPSSSAPETVGPSRWRRGVALPGRTMRLSAATATSRSEIETVEMRTADGVVVLTADGLSQSVAAAGASTPRGGAAGHRRCTRPPRRPR